MYDKNNVKEFIFLYSYYKNFIICFYILFKEQLYKYRIFFIREMEVERGEKERVLSDTSKIHMLTYARV